MCKSLNKREAFSNKSIYILKSALKYSNINDTVDFLNTSNKSAQF